MDCGLRADQEHRALELGITFCDTADVYGPHTNEELVGRGLKAHREKIIIATGTKPASSPLVPFNNRNIINSDQILQMPQIPKTMIVVGGGVMEHPGLLEAIRTRLRALIGGYLETSALGEQIDSYLVPPDLGDDAGVLGALALAQLLEAS